MEGASSRWRSIARKQEMGIDIAVLGLDIGLGK